MASRKQRKYRSKKGFHLGNFFSSLFRFVFQAVPVLILGGLLAGGVFGIRNFLYADPGLVVQKVEIYPADGLTADQKLRLESDVIGRNIFKVSLVRIADKLERGSEIQRVRVNRRFPSTIQVQIEKRMPFAYIQLAPKGLFGIVSEDGMVLDVDGQANTSLLEVHAYSAGQKRPEIGEKVKVEGFSQLAQFVRKFWAHPISKREVITRVDIDPVGNIAIVLGNGPEIRLGRYPAERLSAFQKIMPVLDSAARPEIDYIDLQFDHVIVKRKKSK